MKDKVWIVYSNITAISTAYYGVFDQGKNLIKEKWEEFCRFAANEGANATRLLPYANFGLKRKKKAIAPYIFDDGKWDLTRWNARYFDQLVDMVKIANKYGLTVWFDLFDGCQFFKTAKNYSPWYVNKQGIQHFMYSKQHSIRWVRKVVPILKKYDVAFSFGNELTPTGGMQSARDWFVAIAEELKQLHIKTDRLMFGANPERGDYHNGEFIPKADYATWQKGDIQKVYGEDESLKVFRQVHKVGEPDDISSYGQYFEQALQWWGDHPIAMWLSDDGAFHGDSDCDRDEEAEIPEIRPSAKTWEDMFREIVKHKTTTHKVKIIFAIEHLPSSFDEKCQKQWFKAIRKIYKTKFGKFPINYKKYPKPEPAPECKDGDEHKVECDDGTYIVDKKCVGGKWVETNEECAPPAKDCKCSYWLDDLHIWTFIKCIFGLYDKRCK